MKLAIVAAAVLAMSAAGVAQAQNEEGANPRTTTPARQSPQPGAGKPASARNVPDPAATQCRDGTATKVIANPCADHGGIATPVAPRNGVGADGGRASPARPGAPGVGAVTPPAQ